MRTELIFLYFLLAWRRKTIQGYLFGLWGISLLTFLVGFLGYVRAYNKPGISAMGQQTNAPIGAEMIVGTVFGTIFLYLLLGGMFVYVTHKQDLLNDPERKRRH